MRKILTLIGTRPEAIKMAPIIKELEKYPDIFKSVVCATAQHRDMLDQVLNIFNIKPNYDLDIMKENQNLFDITSSILKDIHQVFLKEMPDIILVQGDTTTTFVSSLSAFYLKIPIAHVEAGLRTYDKFSPFPEEVNRHLTTVLADLHFAPTQRSKNNLLKEDVDDKNIFITGNTVIDALIMAINKDREYDLSIPDCKIDNNKKIILVTAHRRENFGQAFNNICNALREIADEHPDILIIYPVHPNPNVKKVAYEILSNHDRIRLISPLDYEPFVHLMNKSYLILTDSGGVQEEAPSLGKPVLVLRDITERPEAIEAGTVKIVGTDTKKIISETNLLLNNNEEYTKMSRAINPYGDGFAAERIVNILRNYFNE